MIESAPDEAERKQVTVLFADVMGSMDLAEQRDPEEWRKIMQRFFSILAAAVERFEGTVDKFTGDGIMAVFGAPVAHEDHAALALLLRPCRCSRTFPSTRQSCAAERGLNFSIRVGINSGEVVAGAIGGEDGEYTAIGHTVGLAQRMEALAEPGKAYLTEHTAELAAGFLELENLGEFEIKGASRPVRGLRAGRGRSGPLQARHLTRARLLPLRRSRCGDGCPRGRPRPAEEGDGAVIGLVAEPGVGKSRLCHEFAERCRRDGIEVFEAQAQAHGQPIPYMPVLQMLRAYFGISERRSRADGRARRSPGGRCCSTPTSPKTCRCIFDFLGVPDPDRPVAADERRGAPASAGPDRLPPRQTPPVAATRWSW